MTQWAPATTAVSGVGGVGSAIGEVVHPCLLATVCAVALLTVMCTSTVCQLLVFVAQRHEDLFALYDGIVERLRASRRRKRRRQRRRAGDRPR